MSIRKIMLEQLEKYMEDVKQDVKLDPVNILEKQMKLPTVKHKWAAVLIRTKIEKNSLIRSKKELREKIVSVWEKEDNFPKNLPKAALDKKIDSSTAFVEINKNLEDIDIIIEFLEKVEKQLDAMNYSITNCANLMKLETS